MSLKTPQMVQILYVVLATTSAVNALPMASTNANYARKVISLTN